MSTMDRNTLHVITDVERASRPPNLVYAKRTAMLLVTLVTPGDIQAISSAMSYSLQVATVPARVTRLQMSAEITVSERRPNATGLTTMSLSTELPPPTR